jgi:hypothetical protein
MIIIYVADISQQVLNLEEIYGDIIPKYYVDFSHYVVHYLTTQPTSGYIVLKGVSNSQERGGKELWPI